MPAPLISRSTFRRISDAVPHKRAPVWFAVYSRPIPRTEYRWFWWLSREQAHRDIAVRKYRPDYLVKVTPNGRTKP
jgi:hypothetical protein